MSSSALIAAESALASATRALGRAAVVSAGKYGIRKIQARYRGRKTRRAYPNRKTITVRRKKRKGKPSRRRGRVPKAGDMRHSALANHYNYNTLDYCVTENLGGYNTSRHFVLEDHQWDDLHSLHDTHTCSNNGTDLATGLPGNPSGTSGFTGSAASWYMNLDFTHGVGKWTSTAVSNPVLPGQAESNSISNQIYNIRQNFKKWRKRAVKFTIKWRGAIDNSHSLSIPEGYYMVCSREDLKIKLGTGNLVLPDTAQDFEVITTTTRRLSTTKTLERKYGIPNSVATSTTTAGLFPNSTDPTGPPPAMEDFTYENIARNPKGWKKIPNKQQFEITQEYPLQFSDTTVSNAFEDPIIFFVFKETPPSWLKTTLHTTGTIAASATDPDYGTGWKDIAASSGGYVNQGTNTYLQIGGADLYTSPEHGTTITTAQVFDMKVLHCYSFANRIEDLNSIPTNYPYLGTLVPY
tara:strand:- start:774 stop:2168 length:1395 start_codon:yes stop_codon:yes gene_type:complete